MPRRVLRYLHTWSTGFWTATQVELQGRYSTDQLQRFHAYRTQTSWLRAIAVCVLTPLPCILVITLVDLIPMEPISNGSRESPNVWIRELFTVIIITLTIMEQVQTHLRQLELQLWLNALISISATVISVAMTFFLSLSIGYPMPFTIVVGTPLWFTVICTMIFAFKHRQLRHTPGLKTRVLRYLMVLSCQVNMTIIYPLYNVVYKRLSSSEQTAFVFVLPIIKILAKNWISKALPDSDDAKPEAVVFNVEIFHALFVSLCMGSTTSSSTIAVLMAVDAIQAWLSFGDVQNILRELAPIALKLEKTRRLTGRPESEPVPTDRSLQHLVDSCARLIAFETSQAKSSRVNTTTTLAQIMPESSPLPRVHGPTKREILDRLVGVKSPLSVSRIRPSPASTTFELSSDLASLTAAERGLLVQHTRKVLYVTEFIVLIEYTEVIMPLIYYTLVVAMYHFPNRPYYTFLDGICTSDALQRIVSNVALYASVEFISLVVMGGIVWWRMRLSFVHQLAFVLESRALNIQSKLLGWVLYVIQTSIVQLGPDYTFQFAWLRKEGPQDAHSVMMPSGRCSN